MLADVHTHLDQDPAVSLTRAQSAGVDIVLAAAVDVASSRINASLAEKFSQVKACIGVHPWRADLFTSETEKALTELLQRGGIKAISETGIETLTLADIVLETDSNEPAQVVEVCEAVALLKDVTRQEVAEVTTSNVRKLLACAV